MGSFWDVGVSFSQMNTACTPWTAVLEGTLGDVPCAWPLSGTVLQRPVLRMGPESADRQHFRVRGGSSPGSGVRCRSVVRARGHSWHGSSTRCWGRRGLSPASASARRPLCTDLVPRTPSPGSWSSSSSHFLLSLDFRFVLSLPFVGDACRPGVRCAVIRWGPAL